MADDARAEARRRIAAAIEDAPWPCRHAPKSTDPGDFFTCDECRADVVLDLMKISEEWRVEGEGPETAEDEGGGWVMYADDRDHAHRLAAEHGGTPIVTLMLSLPVEP